MNLRPTFLILFVLLIGFSLRAEHDGKIQILLLGDSTTEGSIPRLLQPEGPHLETVMEELLAAKDGLPPCRVINSSQSGEYIRRMLDSGRYQSNGADYPGIDYIFIRYGINDRARLENFSGQFPADFHELIGILRNDHPNARIIPTTVIPFSNEEASREMNDLIVQIAGKEGLEVFDLYPLYAEALKQGPNMLNYRRYSLENIPEQFCAFVKPRVHGGKVVVMDNEWDALFGHLPGWFGDRHPNLAGYNVIATATVDYLVPILKQAEESKVKIALVGDSTVTDSAG
ncbi:MAG: SGNH/GDSL hydrolase family protein, partial [Verrucomicrobiales bacterium]|nr:SGNH/GDSL hydrolase family protein [Verrucomicrobiales bacterium]